MDKKAYLCFAKLQDYQNHEKDRQTTHSVAHAPYASGHDGKRLLWKHR
jgi:hypothetical protein